jgi:hypothetical protein
MLSHDLFSIDVLCELRRSYLNRHCRGSGASALPAARSQPQPVRRSRRLAAQTQQHSALQSFAQHRIYDENVLKVIQQYLGNRKCNHLSVCLCPSVSVRLSLSVCLCPV